jgi:hypothetical protein
MEEYPNQVEAFHQAMRRLIDVYDIDMGLKNPAAFTPESCSFAGQFCDLPRTFLRRTKVGRPGLPAN